MKNNIFSLILLLASLFYASISNGQSVGALKGGVAKLTVNQRGGPRETGSGILIGVQDNIMYILTALHTVEDYATIQVQLFGQSVLRDGEVHENIDRRNDLAVVMVSNMPLSNNILVFDEGETQALTTTDQVFVIGHPNNVPWVEAHTQVKRKEGNFIVLDKTPNIDRGNSGGPVINQSGELVGMVTEVSSTEVKALKIDHIVNKLGEWKIPYKLRIAVDFCPTLLEIVNGAWEKFEYWRVGEVMPYRNGGSQCIPIRDITGIGQSRLLWGHQEGYVRYYAQFPSSTEQAAAYRDYQNLIKDIDGCLTKGSKMNLQTRESDNFKTYWNLDITGFAGFVKGDVYIWLRSYVRGHELEVYRSHP